MSMYYLLAFMPIYTHTHIIALYVSNSNSNSPAKFEFLVDTVSGSNQSFKSTTGIGFTNNKHQTYTQYVHTQYVHT